MGAHFVLCVIKRLCNSSYCLQTVPFSLEYKSGRFLFECSHQYWRLYCAKVGPPFFIALQALYICWGTDSRKDDTFFEEILIIELILILDKADTDFANPTEVNKNKIWGELVQAASLQPFVPPRYIMPPISYVGEIDLNYYLLSYSVF